MSPPSLSTPSFEPDSSPPASTNPAPWRRALAIVSWTIAALTTLDITVNQLFPYPTDRHSQASSLETYFNYGRSAAGKLEQMVGPTDETSHELAQVGWLHAEQLAQQENQPALSADPAAPLVAFYGMSFTKQLGAALAPLAPELAQRHIAAPSAGPSYAFAAYEADAENHHAEIVVLGILADSVKALKTMTAASWLSDSPSAYSYPRYHLQADELVTIEPQVQSLGELRAAMADPQLWQAYRAQLAKQDAFYHSAIFERSWLDRSVLARLIRRSLAQEHFRKVEAQIYNEQAGFIDPEINALLATIVERFVSQARARNQFPIVLLIDSQGYNDHLLQLLQPTLEQQNIAYLSTHHIAPADNPNNYIPDSHFTEAVNQKLAQAFLNLLNQHLSESGKENA